MAIPSTTDSDEEEKISCWKKIKRRVPVFTAIFLMLFCSSLYFVFMLVFHIFLDIAEVFRYKRRKQEFNPVV